MLRYQEQLTEEWLRSQYVAAGRTVEQVAADAGVCTQTIYRALRRPQIPLRSKTRVGNPYSLGDVLTEEVLRDTYELERSVRSIAEEIGCSESAVMYRLRRYDIPRRGAQPADMLETLNWRSVYGRSWRTASANLAGSSSTGARYMLRSTIVAHPMDRTPVDSGSRTHWCTGPDGQNLVGADYGYGIGFLTTTAKWRQGHGRMSTFFERQRARMPMAEEQASSPLDP